MRSLAMLILATTAIACASPPPTTSYQTLEAIRAEQARQRAAEAYRQQRVNDQILQHGYGGCTPNYATGGCL